jgi:hypothetical protein
MVPLFSFQFLLYSLIFLFSSFLIYFVPGWLILVISKRDRTISDLSLLVLSSALSIGLWSAQGFILGYAHLRWVTYAYVLLLLYGLFMKRKALGQSLQRFFRSLHTLDKLFIVLLVMGMSVQLFQVVGSGLVYADGVRFFRTHGYDGMFHLGLIEHMKLQFPPNEPSASNMLIANYHYWSDLGMAEQSRLFAIPVSLLFFQFMPILISFLTGVGLIALLKKWNASRLFISFALFFLYFGADAGFLITYWAHRVFNFNYPVLDNGANQFLNMPHAVTKALFLSFMLSLHLWMEKKHRVWGATTAFLCAVLFGMKIYFGLYAAIAFGLLFFLSIGQSVFSKSFKQDKKYLIAYALFLGLSALAAVCIYLPPNRGAGGLGYYPLEWPKLMLNIENIDWKDLLYRRALAELLHDQKRIIFYDGVMAFVCLVAIHGTRLLGFIWTPSMLRFFGKKWMSFFVGGTLLYTFLGLYTLQTSGSFNVYNFFAVSATVLALLSAYLLADIVKWNRWIGIPFAVLVVVLTLPRIVYETSMTVDRYKNGIDMIVVSPEMVEAYAYMKSNTPQHAIIQSSPSNRLDTKSSYLSAFTGRQSYLAGIYLLETHNQPFKDRQLAVENLFHQTKIETFISSARALGIDYVYYDKQDADSTQALFTGKTPLFENKSVVIYAMK